MATFKSGEIHVVRKTKKGDANFALIGNFNGEGYRVISMHSRLENTRVQDVHNDLYTDVRIAFRID